MQNVIPTLFCINAGYVQHAAVTIVSLLENNKDSFFEIAVVSTEPLRELEEKLKRTVRPYTNCSLRWVQFNGPSDLKLPVRLHYTIDSYSRLWVAEFFARDVERVLYLDADIVVMANIDELWRTDLGDCILAAVTIPGSTRCPVYRIPERFGYFQSGVMLIDLKRWRSEGVPDKLLAWMEPNAETIADADQDVLNACLYDRRKPLSYIWNVIAPFYFNSHPLGLADSEVAEIRRDARIIHYNGVSKPWNYLCPHPRRAEYWKYLQLTEWRDFTPKDKNLVNWARRMIGPRLPRALRGLISRA